MTTLDPDRLAEVGAPLGVLIERRASLAADLFAAREAADLQSADRLDRELVAVEDEITQVERDCERRRVAEAEIDRREEEVAAAETERLRRADIAIALVLRADLASEIDVAVNTLASVVSGYLRVTDDLELLDQATPWPKHPARLAEWLHNRLHLVMGVDFHRAQSEVAARYSFADIEQELAGQVTERRETP